MKEVVAHLQSSPGLGQENIQNCQEFLRVRSQQTIELRFDWQSSQTLPPGWRMRRAEASQVEFFLSPHNTQYKSRFSAVQDMMVRADLYTQQEVELMKEKLISEESWQVSSLLPAGWLYKVVWEGHSKNKILQTNIWFLSGEGFYFESMKSAREYIRKVEGYQQSDDERCQQFLDEQRKLKSKSRYDWEEAGESLPAGWCRRTAEGKSGQEFILSPEGEQFKSRLSALQAMVREKYPAREISQMRSVLRHEGWTSHKLLPRNWFYKKSLTTWNKRKVTDYSFLSAEGPQFASMRSARQFLVKTKSYSTKQLNNWDSFVKGEGKVSLENSHDWSDASCLPQGWRTRVGGGGEGRRYYLSPGGQQFLSLLTAYQHILSASQPQQPPASLAQVRSSLASEGWQQSDQLPADWLSKHTTSSVSYLDSKGNTYSTAKKALEAVQEDSSYSPEERSLLRKIVEAGEVSLDEKYNWRSYPELPEGWKVRRKVSRSRKMIDFYLAPDGKHIRGRTSAVQHLISLGGQDCDVSKLKNFSWFKIRKTRDSLDNTLEELVSEQSDLTLSSSFDSNASDMSDLCDDEKNSEVEQCQEYSGQDILDKLKHLQKLVERGQQSEAQQTLLEMENSVTLNNKRRKQ